MTSLPERRRNIGYAIILADFAVARGMSLRQIYAGSDIEKGDIDNPDAAISFEQEYRLIRNLLDYCGDIPGLGLEVGRRYRFTSLDLIGFAMVSSPTIRSAIDLTFKYSDLNVTLTRFIIESGDGDLVIGFRHQEHPEDIQRFVIERTIGALLTIAGDLLGRAVTPKSLEFHYSGPAEMHIYKKLTGITPAFNQTRSQVVLVKDDVDQLLINGNPIALRNAEEYCRQLLLHWKSRSGLSAQVREFIARQPSNMPGMEETAKAFYMSSRTLHRRLKEERTSYLMLADEVRKALAEQLLMIQRLPIEQVAERLGYSESASFIHAFRRWTGQSPLAFRKKMAVSIR